MKILVTGASGMVGTHVKSALTSRGHEVLYPSRSELDLTHHENVSSYLKSNRPEAIIHCAALVGGIQANIAGGQNFLLKNIEIDHSIIFAARDQRIQNFIYIGSSCMYPANRETALSESDLLSGPLEPTNESYAIAKLLGSKLVQAIGEETKLNWKTFIASNLFGPNDHFEPERSHLIAAIIKKISLAIDEGKNEIEMWGDGSGKREFTYVSDFAEWIAISIGNMQNFPPILNVGIGIDYTIREYYEMVMRGFGVEFRIFADLTKPNGNLRKLMNSGQARELGWKPQTTIEDGILKTVAWYRKQNNG